MHKVMTIKLTWLCTAIRLNNMVVSSLTCTSRANYYLTLFILNCFVPTLFLFIIGPKNRYDGLPSSNENSIENCVTLPCELLYKLPK